MHVYGLVDENGGLITLPPEKKVAKRKPAFLPDMHDRPMKPGGPRKTLHPTLEDFPVYLPNLAGLPVRVMNFSLVLISPDFVRYVDAMDLHKFLTVLINLFWQNH